MVIKHVDRGREGCAGYLNNSVADIRPYSYQILNRVVVGMLRDRFIIVLGLLVYERNGDCLGEWK